MAFVTVSQDDSGVKYVDPEKIVGYSVVKVAKDCHTVHLDAVGSIYKLENSQTEHGGWPSQEAALSFVEDWFVTVMEGVRQLRERMVPTGPVVRVPFIGDVYRIHERYWEVTNLEPGDKLPLVSINMLLDSEGKYNDVYQSGAKSLQRQADWFENYGAEFVGNREDIEVGIEQLIGRWEYIKPFIQNFMDGFTGREEIVVHYGDEASEQVYCCDREFKFYKGHAFTHDPERVTCPQYRPVVHYAEPRDNQPRCCGAKYPLDPNHTWTADLDAVTCPGAELEHYWCDSTENHVPHIYRLEGHLVANPRVVRCDGWPNPNSSGEFIERKPCGSTKGHEPHAWEGDDEVNYDCPGLTFPNPTVRSWLKKVADDQEQKESKPEPPSKPCSSTKGHGSHTWQEWEDSQEGPLWSCSGLTFPDLSAVDSSGDQES